MFLKPTDTLMIIWAERFHHSRTPLVGEAGGDGIEVLGEEAREAPHRSVTVAFGLADSLQQEVTSAVADQVLEDAGQVVGAGDVRAGEADLVELLGLGLGLALGRFLPRSHDPAIATVGGSVPLSPGLVASGLLEEPYALVHPTGHAARARCR